ncbi:uncharacterized protein BDR25DRAFT_31938 [Lindgomyces ingoldianus]|uniref:Uncharacterized protein n=1 Tax=Lindgomyces ingoldianus TaxID=673940 RepID=A0ACB6QUY7_9PLEO|nr:uncharacterized protein BDR25DRAFT_31938 [Lindgomyces ingoldianus]KAF2470700.1 hypothetical protein BDR25DRAFT_31938 [Lindgomyces ingoldianus]
MRSFTWLVLITCVSCAVLDESMPAVTLGPKAREVEAIKRDGPDAVSLAKVLLTAIPESLREIAATNVAAVSSILWEEFLDDKKPSWFTSLPPDIQSYLVQEFGPKTAVPSATASTTRSATGPSAPKQESSKPAETRRPSRSSATTPAPLSSSVTLVTSIITVSMDSIGIPIAAPTSSSVSSTSSPTSSPDDSGLSKQLKIGLGVGVPLAVAAIAVLACGCCLLRRRRRSQEGSVPPSSPGFIPRFAFQEKSYESLEQQHPLHRRDNCSTNDYGFPSASEAIMAPAVYYTHSSNRARGRRTSYTSLQSVTEVSEPDEVEPPVLPHRSPKRQSVTNTPIPIAQQVKRKPLPSSSGQTPVAELASQSLLQQTMSGITVTRYSPPRFAKGATTTASPMEGGIAQSPSVNGHDPPRLRNSTGFIRSSVQEHNPKDPFSNDYSYVEDYGPEFHNGYMDIENGLYGGNTSLSRYPDSKPSKMEWPLRNCGVKQQRNKSPLWDRVYDGTG